MAVVRVVTQRDAPMLVARFPEQGAAPVSRHVARFELQKQNLITYLAAWEGDEPAGYVLLRWSGSPDLTEQAKRLGCVELADLWVAEHMRGHGIGRQLLTAAESIAAARGYLRLGLEVTLHHPFNARARQLYERSGYRDAGFAPFVSGYTYWDASGISHRDDDVYIYLVKDLARGLDASTVRLTLVEPSDELSESFLDLVEELKSLGQPLADTESLDRGNLAAYIRRLHEIRDGIGLEHWQVPMSTFWLLKDARTVVGISRLRHRLTATLHQQGGHIGFLIRPSARRRGYGSTLLALTLLEAHTLDIDRVLLTCDSDNLGSRKIIENNHGELEDEEVSPVSGNLIRRYWIMKDRGRM